MCTFYIYFFSSVTLNLFSSYSNRDQHESVNRDEYSGLMTAKDKQWLLNIQMMQLNTGTPYFDDYYYTVSGIKLSRAFFNTKNAGYCRFTRSGKPPARERPHNLMIGSFFLLADRGGTVRDRITISHLE